jgi:RHH-type rel operon transcriptional repressor/antitoxin RelB
MVYVWHERVTAMNKRVTIEMPDEMLRLVEEYAAEAGAATDAYLREVIEQHLEDLHDITAAEAAMQSIRDGEPTYTLEEVKQRLGLDD